jgi:hypothetical protein
VVMKNQKILQFRKPPEEPDAEPIICQIGSERFAIHYEIEDLPPAVPALRWRQATRKVVPKTVE